jgi:hypothetical protein
MGYQVGHEKKESKKNPSYQHNNISTDGPGFGWYNQENNKRR